MSLIDKHFEDALKNLPEKKLSWSADRRLKKMLRKRAAQLDGKGSFWTFFRPLVAVPMALALLLTTTTGYAYTSSSVVKGDLLYGVKSGLEVAFYPDTGSSEERVAYHLWLSERRYAEVNEILTRLGKKPLAFIPGAYAQELQDAENPLQALLLESLQSAMQHVDYALLITDEIRETKRVEVVQGQIRDSLEQQKEFFEEVAPVLEEVKLEKERKGRQKRVRKVRTQKKRSEVVDDLAEGKAVIVESPLLRRLTPEEIAASEAFLSQPVPDEDTADDVVEEDLEEFVEVEIEVEEDVVVDDLSDLIADRLAFQEDLLEKVEETVLVASREGDESLKLELDVTEVLVSIPEDEVVVDEVFAEALLAHQEVLGEELKELDQVLVAEAELELSPEVPQPTDEDGDTNPPPEEERPPADLPPPAPAPDEEQQKPELKPDEEPLIAALPPEEKLLPAEGKPLPPPEKGPEEEPEPEGEEPSIAIASLPAEAEEEVFAEPVADSLEEVSIASNPFPPAPLDENDPAVSRIVDEAIPLAIPSESAIDPEDKDEGGLQQSPCQQKARTFCQASPEVDCLEKMIESCEEKRSELLQNEADNEEEVTPLEETVTPDQELEVVEPPSETTSEDDEAKNEATVQPEKESANDHLQQMTQEERQELKQDLLQQRERLQQLNQRMKFTR